MENISPNLDNQKEVLIQEILLKMFPRLIKPESEEHMQHNREKAKKAFLNKWENMSIEELKKESENIKLYGQ